MRHITVTTVQYIHFRPNSNAMHSYKLIYNLNIPRECKVFLSVIAQLALESLWVLKPLFLVVPYPSVPQMALLCSVSRLSAKYSLCMDVMDLQNLRSRLMSVSPMTAFACRAQDIAKSSHFNRPIRSSLNLFFGNMPLTALFSTSPPPHFSIIFSMLMLFKLPGRVVCR